MGSGSDLLHLRGAKRTSHDIVPQTILLGAFTSFSSLSSHSSVLVFSVGALRLLFIIALFEEEVLYAQRLQRAVRVSPLGMYSAVLPNRIYNEHRGSYTPFGFSMGRRRAKARIHVVGRGVDYL